MKQKKKKLFFSILFIVLISACISFLYVNQKAVHKITNSYGVVYKNGYVYGMDLSEDHYFIFQTNMKTMKSRIIQYPRIENGSSVEIRDIAVDKLGNAYAYKKSLNGKQIQEEIVLCNFQKGILEEKFNLSDISLDTYWTFIEHKDEVMLIFAGLIETNGVEGYEMERYLLNNEKETFELYDNQVFNPNYTSLYFTDRKDIICGNVFGSFISQKEDRKIEKIFENDGSKIGIQNVYFNIIDDRLHFRNIDTGLDYKIDLYKSPKRLEVCKDCSAVFDYELSEGKIVKPAYQENGVWTAYVRTDNTKYMPFIYENEKVVLDKLELDLSDCLKLGVKSGIYCIIAFLAMYIIYKIIIKINQGVFPLAIKMIIVIIPLLIFGCYILENIIEIQLKNNMMSSERKNLYNLGMASIEKVHMDWYESISEREITPTILNNMDQILGNDKKRQGLVTLYDITGAKLEDADSEDEQLYTTFKEGEFYNITDTYNYNIPLSYVNSNTASIAMKKAANEKKAVGVIYDNFSGQWLAVFIPIINEKNEVIGLVESRMNTLIVTNKVVNIVNRINKYIFYGSSSLFIALIFMVAIALWPLTGLRKAVVALMNGKYNTILKVKGNSEISAISDTFNRMAVSISGHMKEMEEYKDKYEAFVPAKFFELLGKEDVRKIELGDTVETEAVIMSLCPNDFMDIASGVDSKEMFGFMNSSLRILVPGIETYEGEIEQFENGGIIAFFTNNTENALCSAISILQKLNQENLTFGGEKASFGVGICQGDLKLGIIGEESRMSAITISEYNNLAGFLQSKAGEYGTGILITDKAAKKITNFEEAYHYRTLGYIYIKITESLEKIYDVYDGDSEIQIRLKKQTKEEFEKGILLFTEKKWKEARSCFVEVLRINRNDFAAQKYFYLCDRYLEEDSIEGSSVEQEVYIETY